MDLFELQAKIKIDDSEYKKSVKEAAQSADDIEDALKDAGKAADKAEDSIDGLGDTAKKTSKSTDGLGDSVENTKDSLIGSIVKADLFTGALSKLGDIAKDVAEYVWNLDEATEEYRVAQGKLTTAFKTNGFSANTAKDAYQGLYRVVGDIDRATEASQLLSQLARNTEDVSSWTTIATGVVGTFGDSLPVESLIESANESARVGQVVGALADALNWAGMVGEDEFNAMLANCATEEERVELITRTLSDTYQEAAEVFLDTNESLLASRDAFLGVQEAEADAGEAIGDFKTTISSGSSMAKRGFFATVEKLTDSLTGFTKGLNTGVDSHVSFLQEMEKKIETGTAEEAAEAYDQLYEVFEKFQKNPIGMAAIMGGSSGLFGGIGFFEQLKELLNVTDVDSGGFGGMEDSLDGAATAAAELDESLQPIIATAGGVSVQLEGTGMTAEEASSRLQNYTGAALNMFESINTQSSLSYEEAIANLNLNAFATEQFATNMTELAGALPAELAAMFEAGGPEVYAGTVNMLAEANRGTDEGLTALNEAWDTGGEAAVNAFLESLGAAPQEADTPADIVAEKMANSTEMETAGADAVYRTESAMENAVASAGFDGPGADAMQGFIDGMESMRPLVEAEASDIANSAVSQIRQGVEDMRYTYGGSYRAGGLDYVPTNSYPAVLHRGEAVLTAREADEWRAGGNTTNSKSSSVNMGGVTINISGQYEDTDSLVERLSEELQGLINRNEAAYA